MSANKSIVLITGGNSGIGFNTAQALSKSPNYHVIIGCRSAEKGQKALSDLQSSSPVSPLSMVQLDVTDTASITAAAAKIKEEFGRLDVLINNAGIISRSPNLLEQLRATFETNTFGPAVVTEAFRPLLEKSGNARLIYVSSGLGSIAWRADPGNMYYKLPAAPYRMSKAALDMLTVCHYAELKDKGVKVWAFDPGTYTTNAND
ncbi:Short-chain dehydrogenase reductase tropE [Hyphodiscus hymeniophilus]|uniref:Short-chain dehydrogenase reductase tropE n=1 Tax=Hyphodiscus hymeniophilus TaxID=353542 RepID=A0A9P6SQR4_9HELO|nr:Short-chain dehydrogenase reductase tropE [Hyphodiscus hymeniophilus]